jgi:ABC-type transporter MlaC component
MTTQRSTTIKAWFTRRVLFAFLLAIGGTHAVFAQATPTPEQATKAFYEWYLKELAADKDPISDELPALREHVSAQLIKQIERKRRSPDGMEVDYFLQAQDYLDDWLTRVVVKQSQTNRITAKVDTTLGEKPDDIRRLRITLVRESGAWKIRDVQAVSP